MGMPTWARIYLGVLSNSASSGGSETKELVTALGGGLTESQDEYISALEATGRGAMLGNSIAGPGGAAVGAILEQQVNLLKLV